MTRENKFGNTFHRRADSCPLLIVEYCYNSSHRCTVGLNRTSISFVCRTRAWSSLQRTSSASSCPLSRLRPIVRVSQNTSCMRHFSISRNKQRRSHHCVALLITELRYASQVDHLERGGDDQRNSIKARAVYDQHFELKSKNHQSCPATVPIDGDKASGCGSRTEWGDSQSSPEGNSEEHGSESGWGRIPLDCIAL